MFFLLAASRSYLAPFREESEGVTRDDRIVVVASHLASSMISSSILYTDVANNRWLRLSK
jgi:hypothetical protein